MSAAQTQLDTAAQPPAVTAAVQRTLVENKHTVTGQSPDGLQIGFRTRKTMFTWELDGVATITPTATGSTLTIQLDTAADRPAALLDGKKNEKAAAKLADQVRAALG